MVKIGPNMYKICKNQYNKTELVNSSGSKWSLFIVEKLALHKNGVEFRQQFNGAICTSLATPYDDVRRRAT